MRWRETTASDLKKIHTHTIQRTEAHGQISIRLNMLKHVNSQCCTLLQSTLLMFTVGLKNSNREKNILLLPMKNMNQTIVRT